MAAQHAEQRQASVSMDREAMTQDEIVASLAACDIEAFPADELRAALADPDLAARLLKSLDDIPDELVRKAEDAAEDGLDYMLPSMAILIASAQCNTAAHERICRFYIEKDDAAATVTGYLVTEELPVVLARTFDGDLEPIRRLLEAGEADESARGAAVNALRILAHRGRITHATAVDMVADVLARLPSAAEMEDNPALEYGWDTIAIAAVELRSEKLKPMLQDCFEREIVPPYMMSWKEAGEIYANPPELEPALDFSRHDDIVTHLESRMGWVAPELLGPEPPERVAHSPYGMVLTSYDGRQVVVDLPTPFRHHAPKVGRNEPCPCGSGKKHKKCCLES